MWRNKTFLGFLLIFINDIVENSNEILLKVCTYTHFIKTDKVFVLFFAWINIKSQIKNNNFITLFTAFEKPLSFWIYKITVWGIRKTLYRKKEKFLSFVVKFLKTLVKHIFFSHVRQKLFVDKDCKECFGNFKLLELFRKVRSKIKRKRSFIFKQCNSG